MRIIEYDSDVEWFILQRDLNDAIVIPILCDDKVHYSINLVSFIYMYFIESGEECLISLSHNDCIRAPMNPDMYFSKNRKYFIINSRLSAYMKGNAFYDIELLYWLDTGKPLPYNTLNAYKNIYNMWYNKLNNLNNIIPVMKHAEYCYSIVSLVLDLVKSFSENDTYKIYADLIIPNLALIESTGLYVQSPNTFINKSYINDNIVHSYYNIYTQTGRPSNTFGNTNYAALDKSSGIRNIFRSRYTPGKLVEFDYDAFHLRLIATCINYTFDDTSIHKHLAQEYFQKTEITEEEYDLSKQITFKQLYGGIDPQYAHIKFFSDVKAFMYQLWETYTRDGFIRTPITNRKLIVDEIAIHKLFNYYLQAIEFETGILVINELNTYLHDKKSKLVLYTYDSFLFDIHKDDGKETILALQTILTNQYPVKCKAGDTYQNMRSVVFN